MDLTSAVNTASDAVGSITELREMWKDVKDRGVNSLSEYAKKTLISSRVYVEDAIAQEPVIPDLLKFANQIYGGLVLTTLGLNTLCQSGRTVRQMMNAVSTEEFHEVLTDLVSQFGADNVAVKSLESGDATANIKEPEKKESVRQAINIANASNKVENSDLFCGRLVEVTVAGGNKDGTSVKLYFYIQLMPYILPRVVYEEFLANNIEPSKALRKAAWKAGEISFWKDYIFECDRVAKRKKALKADKDGILREIEDVRAAGIANSIWSALGKESERKRNCASSILVLSRQTIDKVCKEYGLNLVSYKDRQNIFKNTLGLMMMVYDPNYETVDMYLNSIQTRGTYTSQAIAKASKSDKNEIDMKTLLTLLASGNVPRI